MEFKPVESNAKGNADDNHNCGIFTNTTKYGNKNGVIDRVRAKHCGKLAILYASAA